MLTRLTKTLKARNLLMLASVVLAFFVLSGISASLWGQDPTGSAADAISSFLWFGFLLGAALLIAASIVSLIAHAISRGGSKQSGGIA